MSLGRVTKRDLEAASTHTLVSDRKSCAGNTVAAVCRGLRHS